MGIASHSLSETHGRGIASASSRSSETQPETSSLTKPLHFLVSMRYLMAPGSSR